MIESMDPYPQFREEKIPPSTPTPSHTDVLSLAPTRRGMGRWREAGRGVSLVQGRWHRKLNLEMLKAGGVFLLCDFPKASPTSKQGSDITSEPKSPSRVGQSFPT